MNTLKELKCGSGWVYSVAVKDNYIFTSSYDGTIKVWDKVSTEILLFTY